MNRTWWKRVFVREAGFLQNLAEISVTSTRFISELNPTAFKSLEVVLPLTKIRPTPYPLAPFGWLSIKLLGFKRRIELSWWKKQVLMLGSILGNDVGWASRIRSVLRSQFDKNTNVFQLGNKREYWCQDCLLVFVGFLVVSFFPNTLQNSVFWQCLFVFLLACLMHLITDPKETQMARRRGNLIFCKHYCNPFPE